MFDIEKYVAAAGEKQLGTYAIIVKQHGETIASHFWRKDLRHNIHSLSKSFTSCALGIAIDEGLLSLEDKVISFFPEKIDGEPSEYLKQLSVKNLMTMCSGYDRPYMLNDQRDVIEDDDWVHYFLNQKFVYEPGTHFLYDTGNTFIISAILEKVTGMHLRDYLMPRIFKPLDIRNPQWFTSPDGINLGGAGLHLNCEEISRFAEMLLNKGVYGGKQLVPAEYLELASSKIVSNGKGKTNDSCGYGLQFWRCTRPGAFRGDGAYGQLAIIIPDEDMTVSITSHNEINTNAIIETVFECIG